MASTPRIDRLERNILINGNFDFWQRGTASLTALGPGYSADRWGRHQFQTGAATQQPVVVNGDHDGASEFVLRISGDGSNSNRMSVAQGVEFKNTFPLRGKTVTFSGLIRFSGASWSLDPGPMKAEIGTTSLAADGALYTTNYGANGFATVEFEQGSLPTTWTKFSVTLTVPSDANNIVVRFQTLNLQTYAAGDWYEVSQVMLNEGEVAGQFSRAGRTIEEELGLCKRYFTLSLNRAVTTRYGGGAANAYSMGNTFSTQMRTQPVFVNISNPAVVNGPPSTVQIAILSDSPAGYVTGSGAVSGAGIGDRYGEIYITYTGIGTSTPGNTARILIGGDVKVGFDAEL